MGTEATPWEAVRAAADRAAVRVGDLTELGDADRIRAVIAAVWGEQILPREMIRAFQHAGSVLYGAEAGGHLVGFVLGFFGFAGGLHLHSHMLGVVPEWQVRGVGYALKLAQRAACLDRGVDEVRWTYDPLLARNAWFNLGKLGTVARRMLPEFYGEMTDRLNRGDRSDRFEVRWRLSSPRVARVLAGELMGPPAGNALLVPDGDPLSPEPRFTGEPVAPGSTVAVPRGYPALKASDPGLAVRWREASRQAFAACFGAGLVATWFTPGSTYVFDEPPSDG